MTNNSSLASVSATQRRLAELGLSTKKSLGQHFLIDDGIVGKILRLAELAHREELSQISSSVASTPVTSQATSASTFSPVQVTLSATPAAVTSQATSASTTPSTPVTSQTTSASTSSPASLASSISTSPLPPAPAASPLPNQEAASLTQNITSQLSPPRLRVVEVGPGIGTLTEALLKAGVELLSVELDHSLLNGLRERYPSLQLLGGDALDTQILASVRAFAPAALVANLPYAVAATIILEYFQQLPSLESATVMVQREVAERIAAKPGSKEYGAYTVKLRLLAQVAGQFIVKPQCFYPPPRVDSTVIRLERWTAPLAPESVLCAASTLADAAFFQRRKTIRNSMQGYFASHALDTAAVDTLLEAAGIDPRVRGETLQPEDFLTLATKWH